MACDHPANKRPVRLTLNEDLVAQARAATEDLSAVVESLLSDYVIEQHKLRAVSARVAHETVETRNRFAEVNGSFAHEHSTP